MEITSSTLSTVLTSNQVLYWKWLLPTHYSFGGKYHCSLVVSKEFSVLTKILLNSLYFLSLVSTVDF